MTNSELDAIKKDGVVGFDKFCIIRMKIIIVQISLFITYISCGQMINKSLNEQIDYYPNNQIQFTFLVFNKVSVDSFIKTYEPLNFENTKINNVLQTSLTKLVFEPQANDSIKKTLIDYKSNTQQPDTASFVLAQKIISATYDKNGQEYFSGSLSYLFFYECLPKEFKYKWHQTELGHFEFNATFFALLRDKCKKFDEFLYGERGYWDDKLKPLFGQYIFNEITPETAKAIKSTIVENKEFEDNRFKKDRENFVFFLDKTIANEWRMILIDWN
ncbi:MAG: hypothetical protein U0V72_11280 [Cytophagales bacterium]